MRQGRVCYARFAAAALFILAELGCAAGRSLFAEPTADALASTQQQNAPLEDYAALLASIAMAKERSPSVAKTSLDTVFKVARLDLAELARKDVFSPAGLKTLLNPNSVLDTPLAQHISNFTEQAGTAIASLLPDTLGPFPLKNGYVQGANLGAALSAFGIDYAPCYISSTPIGAFLGATGAYIAPHVVNNFDSGMSAVAEGLVVFPAAITITPLDTQIEAIGGIIAPTLISITPVKELHLRTGLADTPVDLAVILEPPGSNGTAPSAPAQPAGAEQQPAATDTAVTDTAVSGDTSAAQG